MKKTFYRISAALTLAALACTLTACGSADVQSSDEPDVNLDQSEATETTVAVQESENDDSSQIDVPEISIPDGKIPDVTISDIHIDLPDTSVPDINAYMSESGDQESSNQETGANAARSSDEQTITDASGDFTYTGALFQGGDDENGYIKVPDGFVNFVDVDHSGLTQYSDATRNNIFTLNHYDGIDYRTAANNIRAHKESETDLDSLEGATVSIADYHALQLYGRYNDGTYIVTWLIEDPDDPDNSTYYLAMEFDSDHQYMVACSSTFETVADHNK